MRRWCFALDTVAAAGLPWSVAGESVPNAYKLSRSSALIKYTCGVLEDTSTWNSMSRLARRSCSWTSAMTALYRPSPAPAVGRSSSVSGASIPLHSCMDNSTGSRCSR